MIARRLLLLLSVVSWLAGAAAPPAWGAEADQAVGPSGLPLPRFVTLRADTVNLRTGPGSRYPIEWVYRRAGWPVEIVAEFEHWRRIRDIDGTLGWVHKSLLSGERAAIVIGEVQTLYRSPQADGTPLLRAQPGVVGTLLACRGGWCRIDIAGHRGWMPEKMLWGTYPDEVFPAD